ncbi:hypothetical protein [Pseudoxanthomonas sp. GM95]|uniref:hypothetical protein n=1 Tax=Pseudoxanthomonas sp. GM95 TaxID=1881043 RepID=UPI001587F20B|nr:hypothetical protein [Pseudoxanthomonas sp. GM95]
MAEEARMSERSEFPRRAISAEERRPPPQRGGECPAKAVLLPFAATKGSRAAKRRESSALDLVLPLFRVFRQQSEAGAGARAKAELSRRFATRATFVLAKVAKTVSA